MTLKQYFKDKPFGAKHRLAKKLGITQTWLSLIISKRRKASAALTKKIEKYTGVDPKTLRPDLFN